MKDINTRQINHRFTRRHFPTPSAVRYNNFVSKKKNSKFTDADVEQVCYQRAQKVNSNVYRQGRPLNTADTEDTWTETLIYGHGIGLLTIGSSRRWIPLIEDISKQIFPMVTANHLTCIIRIGQMSNEQQTYKIKPCHVQTRRCMRGHRRWNRFKLDQSSKAE